MKESPLVSIIIPCYNHEKFIEETILSVLQSTYRPIEIIVVNDGSTDQSELVIKRIADCYKNIQYIGQENAGPSAARNRGIEKASGTYILPLDADDLISDNYIEKAVDVLEKQPHVKLVYCRAVFFGRKKRRMEVARI
jgi:glycosyltransferase involved in cell wall biosynthesis